MTTRWKQKPGKAVRRPKSTRDLSLKVEQGRASRADRPQRRRQDHRHQSVTGVLKPNAGRILLEGKTSRFAGAHAGACAGLSRTFQIKPAYADLTRSRPSASVSERLARRRLVAADGHARRRQPEIAENLARFRLLRRDE